MVTHPMTLLAQASPLLDPPTRAVLAMAFLAFVILGMGLIVGVMLGGRWFRRWGGDQLRHPLPLRKPAASQDDPPLAMLRGVQWDTSSEEKSDTTRTDSTDETRVSDSKHSA